MEKDGLETVRVNEATAVIERLCKYIYSHDRANRPRTRAILCHIYHLALYDDWYKARDLMLMSNLQSSIDQADQSTMVSDSVYAVRMAPAAVFYFGFISLFL